MDDLDRREAFLLAIFAFPDDDLPRLVFADYLDERGETDFAHEIRRQCHLARISSVITAYRLDPLERTDGMRVEHYHRGFRLDSLITCTAELLADPERLRLVALTDHPHWYGCAELKVTDGRIASSKPISTVLHSPVTQKVARLDLSGAVVGGGPDLGFGFPHSIQLLDFEYRPTVTLQAVEALVGAREARRFTHLDLRNNDLDNDAARAIIRSPYLTRLQSLQLSEGNQLRGRTWASLLDRFGEAVVS